jgi:SPP1 gp7 family putative phage head morphogenesis protein
MANDALAVDASPPPWEGVPVDADIEELQSIYNAIRDRRTTVFGKTVDLGGGVIISKTDYNSVKRFFHSLDDWSKRKTQEAIEDLRRVRKGSGIFNKQLADQVSIRLFEDSPEISNLVTKATQDNARMIRTISTDYLDNISATVDRSIKDGASLKKLTERLRHQTGVTESRARFWGRDQTSKVMGKLNWTRHTSAGFKYFTWLTVTDGRVRDTHMALHGQVFGYNDGAGGLFPGTEYNCRCWYQPCMGPEDGLSETEIRQDMKKIERMSKKAA